MTKIEVLMSTYNGERYVDRQIKSILNQKEIDTHITIRDDGSTDATVQVINQLIAQYPQKIHLIEGDNIGCKKSFIYLLSLKYDAEFYAFSDQDDFWHCDKLKCALEKLSILPDKYKLYASNLFIKAEDLTMIEKTCFSKKAESIQSTFVRHRLAGCTFLFNKRLKDLIPIDKVLQMPTKYIPSHDFLICACASACGKITIDDNAYIDHIRYKTSVTAGGNGIWKRIKIEFINTFLKNRIQSTTASLLLNTIRGEIKVCNLDFLNLLNKTIYSYKSCIYLCLDNNFSCGIWICDILCRLKIVLKLY